MSDDTKSEADERIRVVIVKIEGLGGPLVFEASEKEAAIEELRSYLDECAEGQRFICKHAKIRRSTFDKIPEFQGY